MGEAARRLLICALVIAAIAGGAVATRLTSNVVNPTFATTLPPAAGASELASQTVASTAWYCVSSIPTSLVFSSMSSKPVSATIAWSGSGATGRTTATVPTGKQIEIAPPPKATGAQAESVTLGGGSVSVGELFSTGSGWSVSQCASSTATSWYFPQGSTVSGNSLSLEIYDPSVTPAVVNIDLLTSTGEAQPTEYQGLSVAPGTTLTEILDEHATQDTEVATVVKAVSGSVVADELQTTGTSGLLGLNGQLGSPSPAKAWAFPYCDIPSGATLTFNVMNPNVGSTRVVLEAYDGSRVTQPTVVKVPGETTSSIVVSGTANFSDSTAYSVVVSASRGVVVGRSISYLPANPKQPTFGAQTGTALGASKWFVPSADPGTGSNLAIEALGSKTVRVQITKSLGNEPLVSGPHNVTMVKPGAPAIVNSALIASYQGPWIIQANGPIAVELDGSPAVLDGVVVVPAYVVPSATP